MTTPRTIFQVLSSFERSFCRQTLCEDQFSECHLQMAWFEHLLPDKLATPDGQRVEVVQTGWWNREAGPDFKGAAIRVDGGEVRHGDIEFHLDAADWARHGHDTDPQYNGVILHISLKGHAAIRRQDGAPVPHAMLADQLAEPFGFIAASLPSSCGSQSVSKPGRCASTVVNVPEDQLHALLVGAGIFRISQRAARIARQIRRDGEAQTLWELLAESLGFKENRIPFRLLSRRIPAALAASVRAGALEPLLFGSAGFLPGVENTTWDDESRRHTSSLWKEWWRMKEAGELEFDAPPPWRFAQTRPANHPQRRLAALVALASAIPVLRGFFEAGDFAAAAAKLRSLSHPYFDRRYTLNGRPFAKPAPLVGPGRAHEILINVAAPWWMAAGGKDMALVEKIKPGTGNAHERLAAARLFGPCARSFKVRTAVEQQGLLHIFNSYCSKDASNCTLCSMPEIVSRRCETSASL